MKALLVQKVQSLIVEARDGKGLLRRGSLAWTVC